MSITLPNYSARDAAITQRPTATALLGIDSEDRYKDYVDARPLPVSIGELNATPYDFTIQKGQPLLNGAFTRLGVTEVNFQYAVPNINAKTNKMVLYLRVGAGPVTPFPVQLVPGFYTPSLLAQVLQILIRGINPALVNFTMTYGQYSGGGIAPLFTYNTNDANVFVAFTPMPTSVYPAISKQLFDILGFHGSGTPGAGGATGNCVLFNGAISGAPTFCQSTRYIDIVCSQLTANQAVKDALSQPISRDVLCRLYLASPADPINVLPTAAAFCPPGCMPFTLYRDFSTAKQIQWIPNCPMGGYLRFEVFDDNGENLVTSDPAGGATSVNWSMTLLATEN